MRWFFVCAAALLPGACATTKQVADTAPDPTVDDTVAADEAVEETPPDEGEGPACTRREDCDDRLDCTQDLCSVEGTCRHIPLDNLCGENQRCSLTEGCTADDCEGDADCANGVFCDGDEQCYERKCYPGEARDCDDGNACTGDACDTDLDRCAYTTLPDCAGDASTDGDVAAEFDPAAHYSGFFSIAPVPSSDCLAATYSISEVRFTLAAGTLTVQAGAFPLAQTPAPAGPAFSASYTQAGCGAYTLSGTFANADTFTGRWSATFGAGTCTLCPAQSMDIYGVRR